MTFKEKVLKVVRNIPEGQTLSYSQVAELSGSPKAARVVGTIMKNNYDNTVPCHRVIKANGEVGQYNRRGGSVLKKMRIEFEKSKVDPTYFNTEYWKMVDKKLHK